MSNILGAVKTKGQIQGKISTNKIQGKATITKVYTESVDIEVEGSTLVISKANTEGGTLTL